MTFSYFVNHCLLFGKHSTVLKHPDSVGHRKHKYSSSLAPSRRDVSTKCNNPALLAQTVHKLNKICDGVEAQNMIIRDSDRCFCVNFGDHTIYSLSTLAVLENGLVDSMLLSRAVVQNLIFSNSYISEG